MPTIGNPLQVLKTKLYCPPLTQDYVPRSRLDHQLDRIRNHPLTLVSAPAGYGKSTTLSAWLKECGCQSAWLSLDENDNDLGSFETYFVASLQSADPSIGESCLNILDGASLPPTRTFVAALLDDLDSLKLDVVLVLDDYASIVNKAIHELISELMYHPHPSLHLVLSTRHDPPLPLSEWRARGQLVEIRGVELRFSQTETASFLRAAMDELLDEAVISDLHRKTEGWPAGLRLATLSFAHAEEFQRKIDEISGSNFFISEYLIDQVLAHLPEETQSFLVQSSLLDRLSAPLCQAVVDLDVPVAAIQAQILALEAGNVFVIPLDDVHEWYRCHHLFQQFLQMRLQQEYSREDVAALHGRASTWFAKHGMIEQALQHALSAGDMDAAVALVAANRQELMNQEYFQRLSRWLQWFPPDVINGSPDLLLLQARFAQIQRFDNLELIGITEKIDALLDGLDPDQERHRYLLAENDTLRSTRHYFSLEPQAALKYSLHALSELPQRWYALRSYCYIYGAAALQMMGNLRGAQELIERGRREDLALSDGPQARNVAGEGFVDWMAADLARLLRVGELILSHSSSGSRWQSHGWAHYFLASAYYHRNDLDHAQFHAQQTFERRYFNHALASVYSGFILALVHQARGKPEQANDMLALTSDFATEIRSPTFVSMVQYFQAELALLQGHAGELYQWAAQASTHMRLSAMPFFYSPQLTVPKVLLAAGTRNGLARTADCLHHLHDFAESTHNRRVLIEVLALESLLRVENGDEEAAMAVLGESLALAQPGGFIRLFVDLGPKMAELLQKVQNRKPHAAYVTTILSAFADGARHEAAPAVKGQMVEPLTDREIEILTLLAERYSNKEIAAELVISPLTVKSHTINLYQKLAVHNRHKAVEAARAMGLIPIT